MLDNSLEEMCFIKVSICLFLVKAGFSCIREDSIEPMRSFMFYLETWKQTWNKAKTLNFIPNLDKKIRTCIFGIISRLNTDFDKDFDLFSKPNQADAFWS